jgi:hypothetical protein
MAFASKEVVSWGRAGVPGDGGVGTWGCALRAAAPGAQRVGRQPGDGTLGPHGDGTWSATGAMTARRADHTAVLLNDERREAQAQPPRARGRPRRGPLNRVAPVSGDSDDRGGLGLRGRQLETGDSIQV